MRLHEIYNVCRTNNPKLDEIEFDEIRINGVMYFTIKHIQIFQEALDSLERVDFLKQYIDIIYDSIPALTVRSSKEIRVDTAMRDKCFSLRRELKQKVVTVIELCETLEYKDIDCGFSVRIPMEASITEFAKYINDFSIILSKYPLFLNKEAEIELQKVDVGSAWMEFYVKGVAAAAIMTAFLALTDKAIILHSHKLTLMQQEQELNRMNADIKVIDNTINLHEQLIEFYTNNLVEELLKEENLSPEDFDRAKLSLEKLSELIGKGLEIHDAIAVDNIMPLFPSSDQWQEVIEGKDIKLLETHSNNMKDGE